MHKAIGRLLAGILVLGWGSGTAEARWRRADTDNFIIYSEGSEQSLRDFAEKLQRFDATLRLRFKIPAANEPNRLTIYLVRHAEDAGRLASGGSRSSIAGFYSPDAEGSFAVSNRDDYVVKYTPESQQTLFHEYGHHFMKRYLPAAFPAWFVEGFAEYYSTVDFTRDGKAEIGKPPYKRAYGLLAEKKIPAETLLFQRPDAMRSSGQMDAYYGRAWLLTHLLFNDPDHRSQLGSYIAAINKGVDAEQAATDAFGDLAQLDSDLDRYLRQRLSYRTMGETLEVAGQIAIADLSPAADELLPLHLERLSADSDDERLTAVRNALRLLATDYPDAADVWFELAMAEWSLSDELRDATAARAAVDRALAIEPKHVRANVLLGRMLAESLQDKGDFKDATWRPVRSAIALANRANPNDPVPLYAYYESFVDQGRTPPTIAIDGLARSFDLAPENNERRVSYAFALANEGKFDIAIALAKVVAFDPHDRGDGLALLDRLETMRTARQGKVGADAVTSKDKNQ